MGLALGTLAVSRVEVSLVHTIKALSPLFTVLSYAVLFRVPYSSRTYIALVPLMLGVILACSSLSKSRRDDGLRGNRAEGGPGLSVARLC